MQQNTSPTANKLSAYLDAFKQNNEAILKDTYRKNYPKIEAFVLANKGTVAEAKDIFQEAFVVVWRNVQQNRFTTDDDSALAGYLYRIAKNKWLDHLRSAHFRKNVPLPAYLENSTGEDDRMAGEDVDYLDAVQHNFAKLGDACRELLRRFYYDREPLKKIAAAFGWTDATAKNNKYRCLNRLRELVKKMNK